jgi:hypothetical protein
MSDESIRRAADAALLFMSVGAGSPERANELSTLVGHVYSDQLRPVAAGDPQEAVDEVCQRFSDILLDHLAIETALLMLIARHTGRAPAEVLDDAVAMLRGRRS